MREQIERLIADLEDDSSYHRKRAQELDAYPGTHHLTMASTQEWVISRLRAILSDSDRVSAEKGTVTRGDEGERL